MYKITSSAAR